MKMDTFLWMLPLVFMFHDFEEILMTRAWTERYQSELNTRLPHFVKRFMAHSAKLSTAGFALAVAEEFLLLSVLTIISIEFKLYVLWAALMLGFFLHLLIHIGQALYIRHYVPAVITSILSSLYCLAAGKVVFAAGLVRWNEVILPTGIAFIFIVLNLVFSVWLAGRFDTWLESYRKEPALPLR